MGTLHSRRWSEIQTWLYRRVSVKEQVVNFIFGHGIEEKEELGSLLDPVLIIGGKKNDISEVPDSGRIEEPPEREVDVEGGANARNHLGSKEGVTAQFSEEVIVNAEGIEFENIFPDSGEEVLERRGGRGEGALEKRSEGLRRRQSVAIDLAVRREGEGVEDNKGSRDHEVGEPGQQEGAEFGGGEGVIR